MSDEPEMQYFPDATLGELKEIDYILSRPDLFPFRRIDLDSLEAWMNEEYGLSPLDGYPTAARWLIGYLKGIGKGS